MTDDELAELRAQKRQELLEAETSAPETTDDATPDSPIYLDDQSTFATTVEAHELVLVDFYADWCGPCQMLEPTVESIAETTEAAVLKVDIDAYQGLAQQYQVRSVPTLLLFVDGDPVERVVGVKPEPALRELISGYTN